MYNWQFPDWPDFKFSPDAFRDRGLKIIHHFGELNGLLKGLPIELSNDLYLTSLTDEAVNSSLIEGERIRPAEVRSSLERQLQIGRPGNIYDQRAACVAKLALEVRRNWNTPLTQDTLYRMHEMLMAPYPGISVGNYRAGTADMQIVSGAIGQETIHFVAPPSERVPAEMDRFIHWFNIRDRSLPTGVITALGHLYFESIHPFEDGNGRIGRALAHQCLARQLGGPLPFSLSPVLNDDKKKYYNELQTAQRTLRVDAWIDFFTKTILSAQKNAYATMRRVSNKTRYFKHWEGKLNIRQEKVLNLMWNSEKFEGGMSTKKYRSITRCSPATATRDLTELMHLGALIRRGTGKSTRYELPDQRTFSGLIEE